MEATCETHQCLSELLHPHGTFLMERLLQLLPPSGTDFVSAVCFVSRAGCFCGAGGDSTV